MCICENTREFLSVSFPSKRDFVFNYYICIIMFLDRWKMHLNARVLETTWNSSVKTDIGLFFSDSLASKRFEKVTTAFPDLKGYDFKLVVSQCFNVYYIK